MSSAVIAITVGIITMLFLVSSWMIIHLGMNPVSGGRPPSDSRISSARAVISGVLFDSWDSDRVVVDELYSRIANIDSVIMM